MTLSAQLAALKAEAEGVRGEGPAIAARRDKAMREVEAAVQARPASDSVRRPPGAAQALEMLWASLALARPISTAVLVN